MSNLARCMVKWTGAAFSMFWCQFTPAGAWVGGWVVGGWWVGSVQWLGPCHAELPIMVFTSKEAIDLLIEQAIKNGRTPVFVPLPRVSTPTSYSTGATPCSTSAASLAVSVPVGTIAAGLPSFSAVFATPSPLVSNGFSHNYQPVPPAGGWNTYSSGSQAYYGSNCWTYPDSSHWLPANYWSPGFQPLQQTYPVYQQVFSSTSGYQGSLPAYQSYPAYPSYPTQPGYCLQQTPQGYQPVYQGYSGQQQGYPLQSNLAQQGSTPVGVTTASTPQVAPAVQTGQLSADFNWPPTTGVWAFDPASVVVVTKN